MAVDTVTPPDTEFVAIARARLDRALEHRPDRLEVAGVHRAEEPHCGIIAGRHAAVVVPVLVDVDAASVRLDHPEDQRRCLCDVAEPRLALPEPALGFPPRRDVLHVGDTVIARTVDQRRADHDRHARPVLADVVLLVGSTGAGGAQALERALVEVTLVERRHLEPRDAAGVEVITRIVDQLQKGVVGVGDRAGAVPEQDADHRRPEQAPPPRFAIAQHRLGGAARGDVAADADQRRHAAVVAAQRCRVDLDPAAAAAQALDLQLDRGRFSAEHMRGERSAGDAVGIGGQHVEPDADGAGAGVELDQVAAGGVEIEDGAVGADQGDGVGPGVEDGAEARFALRELPVGLGQPVDLQFELANPGGR